MADGGAGPGRRRRTVEADVSGDRPGPRHAGSRVPASGQPERFTL